MAYFNASNVFSQWDLNPLSASLGVSRDSLASARDAFLQPQMAAYRDAAARYGFPADQGDYALFMDPDFRAYVQSGVLPVPAVPVSAPTASVAAVLAPLSAASPSAIPASALAATPGSGAGFTDGDTADATGTIQGSVSVTGMPGSPVSVNLTPAGISLAPTLAGAGTGASWLWVALGALALVALVVGGE